MLQRKCACGGSVEVEEECAECKAKREAALQRSVGNQATPSVATTVPPIVHDVLRSPGHPLDADARAFMEPRFGHDFSQVRVHSDAKAAESAWAVNALAYTIGRDVVFGAGRYAPGTSEGRKLLAHELTHVVQQCVQSRLQTNLEIGVVDDVFEREASEVATHVQDGKTSTPYVRFDRPALHREILQRAAIEDDARFLMVNCMELTCDDVYACPDNDNGITCPEGTLHASEKFRPLLYCDKDCKNKKTCDDNAEWIALPHSNFADGSYKQCDEDLVICANHKFTHAKVRERSNKEAWEASNAVAKALGENPDFKGSVYGDEKDREFKKDTRCHKKKPPREKKS